MAVGVADAGNCSSSDALEEVAVVAVVAVCGAVVVFVSGFVVEAFVVVSAVGVSVSVAGVSVETAVIPPECDEE